MANAHPARTAPIILGKRICHIIVELVLSSLPNKALTKSARLMFEEPKEREIALVSNNVKIRTIKTLLRQRV
jgi:hypothetical protein